MNIYDAIEKNEKLEERKIKDLRKSMEGFGFVETDIEQKRIHVHSKIIDLEKDLYIPLKHADKIKDFLNEIFEERKIEKLHKPIEDDNGTHLCPECESDLQTFSDKYCSQCGIKIYWAETT